MNLIAADVGRPITDIKTSIRIPELKQWVSRVIDTLEIYERRLRTATENGIQ